MLGMCAVAVMALSGCTTIAEMSGADSATLNYNATQGFNKTVTDARSKNVLDTSSATYKKINNAFVRLKPYADQLNQTGQKFDWQLSVLKSNELNAFVMPGGKVVFFKEILPVVTAVLAALI